MIRQLFFILKLSVLIGIAVWFANQDSSLILDWRGYRFQTNTAFLFVLFVVLVLILSGLTRLWHTVRGAPRRLTEWREESKINTGLSAFTRGLVALSTGDTDEAKRQAVKVQQTLVKHQGLAHLLSAQAASLDGDQESLKKSLKAISNAKDDAAFLGIRGLLAQAIKEGDLKRALKLTHDAQKLEPKTAWIFQTRLSLQAQLGLWIDAEKTVKHLQKSKWISSEQAKRFNSFVHLELSKQMLEQGRKEDAGSYAREAFRLNEASSVVAIHYATMIAAEGRSNRAASIIEKAWKRSPHPDLAQYYYQLFVGLDAAQILKRVTKFTKIQPNHRDSLLMLASARAEAGDWSGAREALTSVAESDPTAGVYKLFATVEEKQHGYGPQVKQWLDKASQADPDPSWVCSVCGSVSEIWHACCHSCSGFATLVWQKPSRTANQNKPLHLLLTGTF